jgi:hypothetical protein
VGVYGVMPLYFPEQMSTFIYFDMVPTVNDGYGPITIIASGYSGIFHNDYSTTKTQNGNLVTEIMYYLFCIPQLQDGKFVQITGQNASPWYYRIIQDNDWPVPGGFYIYRLSKLVGTNGGTTINPGFSDGSTNFG